MHLKMRLGRIHSSSKVSANSKKFLDNTKLGDLLGGLITA